jgi:hypothetical protein
VTRLAGLDRKTVRRYVQAAEAAGVSRGSGDGQLTEELLGAVVAVVRPDRPRGNGASWEGFGRRQATVRVADGKPGQEVQVDFGRLGLVPEPATGRRRVAHGLIFTAVYSRHMFVYPTLRQTLEDVVAGFEAAWVFLGGVFAIVVPDNMKAIVDHADATDPRLNDAFREYAQARGFVVDPARVRHPRDKPRVERRVQYARSNFFAGEDFHNIDDCRQRAVTWCAEVAGTRVHGTTQRRPAEVFDAEERPLLLPAPENPGFAAPSPAQSRPGPARPDRQGTVLRARRPCRQTDPGPRRRDHGQTLLARATNQSPSTPRTWTPACTSTPGTTRPK